MKAASKHRFELRGPKYRPLGQFSEQELAQKIADGEFSGEEEIREVHDTEWHKLASHPTFYDAFLRRLFGENYKSPSQDVSKPATPPKKNATIQVESPDLRTRQLSALDSPQPSEEPSFKTRRVPQPAEPGHTVHQSDIDALFSESGKSSASNPKTMMVPVSADATQRGTAPWSALQNPVVETDLALSDSEAAQEKKKAVGHLRRRGLVVLISALLLVYFLLKLTDSDTSQTLVDRDSEWESIRREALQETGVKEERIASLINEADEWIRNDTELFYHGAEDVLLEAKSWDAQHFGVLTRLALVQARLLTQASNPEQERAKIQEVLNQARRQDPHASVLYRIEAISHLASGDLQKAKEAALSAAETDPHSSDNYLLVGELHYVAGALQEARTVLSDAVKADPKNLRARYFLARTALEQKDMALAQEQSLEALKLNPLHPRSYLVLGMVAKSTGQLQEAKSLFESGARLARFSTADVAAQAYFQLGLVQDKLSHKSDSQKSYRLAYFYSPKPSDELKELTSGLNLEKKSLEELASAEEFRSPYFVEQGEGLIKQRKFKEALRFYQAAYLLDAGNPRRLIELGDATERTADSYEDFRRVVIYYQRAIRQNPKDVQAYIKLGELESAQYNFERAYKLLNQALLLEPESAAPHVALGKYFYRKQDVDEALTEFLKAAQLEPTSEVFYYAGLLRMKYKKGGEKEAEGYFYKAFITDPKNTEALAAWLRIKAANHDRTYAIKFVNALLEKEPDNAELNWVLGEVYAASNEYRRAVTYYHRSLDLDNRNSRVRMSLASALEAVGQLDRAVAEYRLAALLDRRNAEGFYKAANLLFEMKKYNQAEEVLRFLSTLAPTYPGVHEYLAKIHLVKKQDAQAIAEMEKEVANNPLNNKFVIELAEMYMQFNRLDDAIKELSKVTNLPSVKKAPEYRYDKIRAYLLLSRCFRTQSKLEGAEGSIKLAIELDPQDPELQRELGYVYYAQQRDKEGAEIFEKYLKQNPSARDTAAIKSMLQKMRIDQ